MSWSDIKRRYEKSCGAATQSTEDMAARRILRALGVAEAKLWEAERESGIGGLVQKDSTLLERAQNLARNVTVTFYPYPPVKDVRSFKEAEDAVLELGEQRHRLDMSRPVAIVYRIKAGKELRALILSGYSPILDMTRTPLPCTVRRSRDKSAVLCDCDAQDFYNLALMKGSENG